MGKKKRKKSGSFYPNELPVVSPGFIRPNRVNHFLIALGLWCLLLWLFQFITLTKFSRAFDVNALFVSFGNFTAALSALNSPVQLDTSDELLMALLIGIPLYLVYLQARFQVLEGAWEIIGNSTWKKILCLSILFLSFCRFALHPGDFSFILDHIFFIAGVDEFWRSLKMGAFADYSTLFYSGWNCRQYMGNLFSVLAGTLTFLTGSHFGVKLFLFVTSAASGLGMFLWIERLTRSRYASLFAGTAFCLNYWHFYEIFVIGQLHMSIVYACLPWPFYFFELGLTESKLRLRYFLLCAIPLAGVVYTHFVWGAMVWGLFTAYSVYRLATRLPRTERPRVFCLFALSIGLEVLILAGMITAPLVQKKESVAYKSSQNFESVEANTNVKINPNVLYQWYNGHWSIGADPEVDGPPQANFRNSNIYHSNTFNSYLGLLPLLFAILGLWGLSGKFGLDSNALRFIMVFLFGSLTLVFFYFELVRIPLLSVFRIFPDHRYQVFLVFFMSAGAAFGVLVWRAWANTRFKWGRNLWGILPLILLAVDVGSTTFQFPYKIEPPTTFKFLERYPIESEAYSNKGENVPYYLFFEGLRSGMFQGRLPGIQAIQLGMPSDLGIQPQTGSRQSIFRNAFYDWLTVHFNSPHVFPDSFSRNYFYLNNFRDAVLFGGNRHTFFDTAWVGDIEPDANFIDLQFRYHTPIVASSIAEPYVWKNEGDPVELGQLYSNMGLDYENATAAQIFVQPGTSLEQLRATGRPVLNLLDYKVYPKKYHYSIQLDQPAYVRLVASYYSFLKVTVDGQRTPFYPGATYEVVLKVPAGNHVIEVEGGWDPYRRTWLFITWIAFAVLGFLAIRFPSGFSTKR